MVFNATFNNISVILYSQFLLVEQTRENHDQVTDKLSYNVVSRTRHEWSLNFSGDRH
jgi:hypothetical protein